MTNGHQTSPQIIDPDHVPETLCEGPVNVSVIGPLACLTFTQIRPEVGPMFATGALNLQAIVRARIAMTPTQLIGLRDLLNQMTGPNPPPAATAGATYH